MRIAPSPCRLIRFAIQRLVLYANPSSVWLCVCFPTEGKFGKAGRDNPPEDTDLFPGESDWSELEPLYRLDEHAYDLQLNFTLSLEDWAHFSRSVDRMFTLLSNDNQPYPPSRPEDGETGRGHALVSSSSQSASAIYLTTLATPALLLKEAGAEVLRDALGLDRGGRPSSFSPSELTDAPPELPEEEEEFAKRRTGRLGSAHCDCNDVSQEAV